MSDKKVNDLLARTQKLKGERGNWETLWQDLSDIYLPRKSNIIIQRAKGEEINELFESGPIMMAQQFATFIQGLITNSTIRWFKIEALDDDLNEDPEVSEWFFQVNDIMFKTMTNPKAGLSQAFNEVFLDQAVFGTSAIQTEEGKKSVLRYVPRNVKSVLIAEDDEGRIDSVVLLMKLTIKAAFQKWGGNLHPKILKLLDKEPFKEIDFQHHIFPRLERDGKKIDKLNKPFASIVIDEKNKHVVDEGGFDTFPIAVGRWDVMSGEIYGRSQGMIALADARQINFMSDSINRATEKILNPPLETPHDGILGKIDLSPRAINFTKSSFTGRRVLEPINTVGNIPLSDELLKRKEESIRKAFFLDQIQTLEDPRATLGQVRLVEMQKLRVLSPLLGRLQSEIFDSLIERTFDILFRKSFIETGEGFEQTEGSLFPPLPEALQQAPRLNIKYVSPINQIQQQTELQSIDIWLETIAGLANFNQDVIDLVDFDNVVKKKAKILGIDMNDLLKDEEDVAQIRDARQQQIEEEQGKEDVERLVAGASQAAQANLL